MLATAGKEAEVMVWTTSERVRERYQATLAGLLELEVLKAKHKQMVEVALGCYNSRAKDSQDTKLENYQYWLQADSRLKLTRHLSEEVLNDLERCRTAQSWSRHSSEEDLLLDRAGHSDESPGSRVKQQPAPVWDDSCSRASSGFCEDGMSEMVSEDANVSFLSNSFARPSTPNAPEVSETLRSFRPIMMKRAEEQYKAQDTGLTGVGEEVIPQDSFFSVASLYPDSRWPDLSEILQPQMVLEPRYRLDLRSQQGTEVYRYPSPLHAVALQSPLYAPQSPIRLNRNLGHSGMKPGSRPASVCLCSHTDLGINSESSFCSSMYLMRPGRACQTLPHIPCEKHRLEALITRLAQSNQRLNKQQSLPELQRANPASGLRRTCSMGKGRIKDNKHKGLKRGEKTDTVPDLVSSPNAHQNLKSCMCANQGVVCDIALPSCHPDQEWLSVSGSKRLREAQDVASRRVQSSPGIGIFSPGCYRRRSTVVSDLPVELASFRA